MAETTSDTYRDRSTGVPRRGGVTHATRSSLSWRQTATPVPLSPGSTLAHVLGKDGGVETLGAETGIELFLDGILGDQVNVK